MPLRDDDIDWCTYPTSKWNANFKVEHISSLNPNVWLSPIWGWRICSSSTVIGNLRFAKSIVDPSVSKTHTRCCHCKFSLVDQHARNNPSNSSEYNARSTRSSRFINELTKEKKNSRSSNHSNFSDPLTRLANNFAKTPSSTSTIIPILETCSFADFQQSVSQISHQYHYRIGIVACHSFGFGIPPVHGWIWADCWYLVSARSVSQLFLCSSWY